MSGGGKGGDTHSAVWLARDLRCILQLDVCANGIVSYTIRAGTIAPPCFDAKGKRQRHRSHVRMLTYNVRQKNKKKLQSRPTDRPTVPLPTGTKYTINRPQQHRHAYMRVRKRTEGGLLG